MGGRKVNTVYLLSGGIVVLILVAIILAKARSMRRRKALEQILERYRSGQALVRYVMLNRQCSEEVAYERLAPFVKKHIPLDDHSSIDAMLADDRQGLLDSARSILVHDPDEIDKI